MTLHECTGEGCVGNPEAISSLIDGGHVVLATALDQSEMQSRRLLDQVRFLVEVMAEIRELTEPARPADYLSLIRIKTLVAIRAIEKSGLLS